MLDQGQEGLKRNSRLAKSNSIKLPKHRQRCIPLVWEKARCMSGWEHQLSRLDGVLAHLVEHLLCTQGVIGSNPIHSTIN
jgi:hypothetical protein